MGETISGEDRRDELPESGIDATGRGFRRFGRRATPASGGGRSEEAEEVENGPAPSLSVGSQTLNRRGGRASAKIATVTKTDAKDVASDVVELIDELAAMFVGEDGKLDKADRERLLRRASRFLPKHPVLATLLEQYIDPGMLLLTFAKWGIRVYATIRYRAAQQQQAAMQQQYEPAFVPVVRDDTPVYAAPTPMERSTPTGAGSSFGGQRFPNVSASDVDEKTRLA